MEYITTEEVILNLYSIYSPCDLFNEYGFKDYDAFKKHVKNNPYEWIYNLTEAIKEPEGNL